MKTRCPVKLMERSIYSQKYCFAENLRRNGLMAESEFQVLSSWFDHLVNSPDLDVGVDLIVYLRTKPEIARERLLGRGFKLISVSMFSVLFCQVDRRSSLLPWNTCNSCMISTRSGLWKGSTNLQQHQRLLKFQQPALDHVMQVIVVDANQGVKEMEEEFRRQEENILGQNR